MNGYRLWFYFRIGNATYTGLLANLVQFLFVAALYTQRVPGFENVHLYELAAIFVVPFGVSSVLAGWLHTRRPMPVDTAVATLANPYIYKITPGKEEKVSIPLSILGVKAWRALLTKEGAMTPELDAELTSNLNMLNRLKAGEEIR